MEIPVSFHAIVTQGLTVNGYNGRMSEQETPKTPPVDTQKAWVAENEPSLKRWADSVRDLKQGVKPAAAGIPRSK